MNTQFITRFVGNVGLKLKQQSPTILLVTGIGSGIAATVMACQETSNAEKVLDEHIIRMEKINYVNEHREKFPEAEYTDDMYRKDVFGAYVKTGIGFVKAYGPAIALGTLSIVSLVASHCIMRRREAELTAAYGSLAALFSNYRAKVKELIGDDEEQKAYDEASNTNAITARDVKTSDLPPVEPYGRFFYGPYFIGKNGEKIPNTNWDPIDNHRNVLFLITMEQYAYQYYETTGHIFLSKVLSDMLGFPDVIPYAHVCGWSKKENPNSFLDLGFRNDENFMNGIRDEDGELQGVWLEPNYDGIIINNY